MQSLEHTKLLSNDRTIIPDGSESPESQMLNLKHRVKLFRNLEKDKFSN